MFSCPICSSSVAVRNGYSSKEVWTKSGKQIYRVQKYRCNNMHIFRQNAPFSFTDSFIEYVVYLYLRCLSLNTTVDIVRATYEKDLLTKHQVLDFIELVADRLPTLSDVDDLFTPVRSGYVALDGVWFSYNDEEIVLLVAFDPETFDIIAAYFEKDETEQAYERLLSAVIQKMGALEIKGIYGDGDNGLIQSRKRLLPHVPFQLCVVHKELRMGQFVPVKSLHISKKFTDQQKHQIKTFQFLFREVIYAKTKEDSVKALERLGKYVKQEENPRFDKAYRSLVRNFPYTLTHFDYQEMDRDNNLLECFNGIIKPRLRLMKSFKKHDNLDRYLKLFLLEFRFRPLKESGFKDRRGQSPLQLADVYLPEYYNFITFLREHFKLSFQPKFSSKSTF
jgi:transposase-like protein